MKSTRRIFKLLLIFFPWEFKNEFGEEMLDVFEQNLLECDTWFQRTTKLMREMQGWIGSALHQNFLAFHNWWKERKISNRIKSKEGSALLINDSGTWQQAIAGAVPILWVPLIYWSSSLIPGYQGWYWKTRLGFLAITLIPAIGLYVAWVKRFPLWSYSYLGVLTAILMFSFSMNDPRYGTSILGFFWIPVIVSLLIAILVTRSYEPILQLGRGIWKDWTRLSFALYGSLTILLLEAFDGIQFSFDFLIELLTYAILAYGAVSYVRSSKITQRAQSLLVGFGFAWILLISVNTIYWNGRQEVWMREPAQWQTTLLQVLVPGMILLGLLFLPIVLSGLRRLSRSANAA